MSVSLKPDREHALASLAYHGGNLDSAMRLFPDAPKPWIDLSTGINSNAYPVAHIAPARWTQLPLASDVTGLETCAAAAFGTASAIVAAPGTQALIQLLPRLLRARNVGILGFTYGEYARVWQQSGIEVQQVETLEQLLHFDLAIIVNPNNPDGRLLKQSTLQDFAAALAAKGGHLVLDEAFMDFTAQYSFAPQRPANVLIVRSFGKTYGLAGLRLGFVLAEPALAASFREALGPWAISGPAIDIAMQAYQDQAWLSFEAARLAAARLKLERALQQAGFEILGGNHLFVLAQHQEAQSWFRHFAANGILTRPFAAHPSWIRFGIPAEADLLRLNAALRHRPVAVSA